jgi:hypothetical protein
VSAHGAEKVPPTTPHARRTEGDLPFLNKYPDRGGRNVDMVTCTVKKKAEKSNHTFAEKKLQNRSVFECKFPAHPFAVTQTTLLTVDITHLDTADERRASLEIVLGNADVHIPVDKRPHDKHVRVPQSIEPRSGRT